MQLKNINDKIESKSNERNKNLDFKAAEIYLSYFSQYPDVEKGYHEETCVVKLKDDEDFLKLENNIDYIYSFQIYAEFQWKRMYYY